MTDPRITGADMPEFCANIIETFEDFLEERGITLRNPERNEAMQMQDPESVALIYGTDYGELQSAIEDIMRRWKLTREDNEGHGAWIIHNEWEYECSACGTHFYRNIVNTNTGHYCSHCGARMDKPIEKASTYHG